MSELRKLKITEMNRLSVEEFKEAEKLPLVVVLDEVRSLHNIGAQTRISGSLIKEPEQLYPPARMKDTNPVY